MSHGAQPPRERTVTAKDLGRVCPYCRFLLDAKSAVMECGGCHAPHHPDCWEDNGGCAVMGCVGGPGAAASAPTSEPTPRYRPPPPPPPPPPPVVYASAPGAGPPPPRPTRSAPPLAAAILVLALAVGGGAVAFALSSKNSGGSATVSATQPAQAVQPEPEATTPAAPAPPPPPVEPNAVLPDVPQSTMEADITRILSAHHDAIVSGSYQTAWVLTSKRYRAKKVRELGSFGEWARGQIDLGKHLDASGLRASIRNLDRRNGVATVDVSGMGWSKERSPCSTWSGVTWARYEDDHWRYEPGYSMSPQRRAEWFPRRTRLLGWGC